MINVVFLLLVFFMVAGSVESPKPFPVLPPESSQQRESLASRVLYVGLDGALALDGEAMTDGSLAGALAAVEGESPLALQADAGITFSRLREVIDALRAAGVVEVELLTTSVPAAATP